MREKFNYLIKNTGYLFIGNFSSKILVFFLVPLYTSVLTTAEYGIYDLAFTTIQLFIPILSFNIIDGVMRFTIDSGKNEKRYIFFISMKYSLLACVLFVMGLIVVERVFDIEIFWNYWIEIVLFFISCIFSQFVVQFARGLDDVKGISIAGMIGTATVIVFNLLFLLVWKFGLRGYFWANICSLGIQFFFLFIHSKAYLYYSPISQIRKNSKKYELDMLIYCWPLVFNTLSWHINGVADRYTVTYFKGIEINGIYSVAYKIPAILNAVQTIFIQAWQLSAIKEFETPDSSNFYKQTYRSVQGTMIILCSLLIMATRILSKLLFAADFYIAWKFVPTLLLYVIFNTLSGTVGGIFSAAKDSKAFSVSAVTGASVNIALNFVLVYLWGAEGAAIATVISSIVIWKMRMYFAKNYVNLELNHALYTAEYILLLLQVGIMTLVEASWGYIMQSILMIVIILMNIKEFKEILGSGQIVNKKSG